MANVFSVAHLHIVKYPYSLFCFDPEEVMASISPSIHVTERSVVCHVAGYEGNFVHSMVVQN